MENKIDFYRVDEDHVITGHVVTAATSYEFALDNFVPLIGRLDIQRDTLKTKFYSRLEQDIIKGCVMPTITIALIRNNNTSMNDNESIYSYITENIKDGFVLDGIQRLNTLKKSSQDSSFKSNLTLHVNFIITTSRDKLLYRMITLNNGQKPMSARHQIDVLSDTFFDFDHLNINLVAEKGNGRVRAPDSFKKADFVRGYIAYLSNSVNIDNQKIIEEKMDDLIASRIIESNIPSSQIEFSDVVDLIQKLSTNNTLKEWVRVQNNFIGFCVGVKHSLQHLAQEPNESIEGSIAEFEKAFTGVNTSKVNLGKVRREIVSKYISEYEELKDLGEYDLLDKISDWI